MTIPYADLAPMHDEIRGELTSAFEGVMDRGWFIQGNYCNAFETAFARYIGADHCVGCGNGLDALTLVLRAAGIGAGDEVIVPAHTFIATALAVTYAGATPVLADVEPDFYTLDPAKIEDKITPRTRAVILVHLYGQIGYADEIAAICKQNNLLLLEDSAQAHGATYKNHVKAGVLGDASGFSFYPGKNLGALGDGGAVTTNNAKLAHLVRNYANYGSPTKYVHKYQGVNSRLDEIQAAFLQVKLEHFERWSAGRTALAQRYLGGIKNPKVVLPKLNPNSTHTWHIFPVLVDNQSAFQAALAKVGIQAQVHYPTPIHLHEAYLNLGYQEGDFPVAEHISASEISLPIYYGMTNEQVETVINVINQY